MDEKYAWAAKPSAGVPEGTCAVQGCAGPPGGQTLNVPASGSPKVELFTKAALVSEAEACHDLSSCPQRPRWYLRLRPMTLIGAKCGQATLGEEFASGAKSFASYRRALAPHKATPCRPETRRSTCRPSAQASLSSSRSRRRCPLVAQAPAALRPT
jgi:hypothetical protein